ncbi:thioesterase family protein [Sphingomonas sp.]|uniref:acyl-CoA thioesterase n=1 Tax=Sphingomonas sp. TaxID=28214 RepID=UPI00325FADBB
MSPERLGRAAYRAWTPITLRWADNDVYGHVNNTVYYQWFDDAVNGWLIEAGLLDVEAGDPIGLVVATSCSYFAPLAFPGKVEVGIAIERPGRSSVTYRVGVFAKGSDKPAAQGQFTHVYVGRESRRPVALPDTWRAVLETLA